ncbi:Endoribonuclease YbeY, partial [Geodia barretti]
KGHVSLVIADDETVRSLNAEYRGLDKTTDVGEYYGEGDAPTEWSADDGFVLPPGESAGLGEVIVSYPQAVRQAQQAGHSIERELAHLITHGILHLMGHDHMDDDEEREMNARERSVAERLAL